MPRSELGTKRICPTTGRKFYDLGRNPVVSPYSGEVVPIAAATTVGRYSAPIVARREAPVDEEDEQEGPELVSLDEAEAEEGGKDDDADVDGDDALVISDDTDETTSDDDRFVVDDEDEDSATGLVDVDEEEES